MIYVCTLSYQRPQKLARLLDSLGDLRKRRDVFTALLEEGVGFPPFDVPFNQKADWHLSSPDNSGIAGGWKRIVDALLPNAQPDDIFVFLDDDAYVTDPSWLDTLIAPIVKEVAEIAGIEGWRLRPDFHAELCRRVEAPDWVANGRCAVSAKIFLSGITFDTDYFKGYEDVQLCMEAKMRGYRVVVVDCPALVHEPHEVSAATVAAVEKSRQIFMSKWGLTPEGVA